MKNAVGREIPDHLPGYGNVKHFEGAFSHIPNGNKQAPSISSGFHNRTKLLKSIDDAIDAVELKDGMNISFHHHLRNGDFVLNMVMERISKKGIRDLNIVPTALFPVHKQLIEHMKSGVVRGIYGSINGPIGREVSRGIFDKPVVLRSHGGRARAIESGDLQIDVSFIASPSSDTFGNITGTFGQSACGPLGYIVADAQYAKQSVAITDNLVDFPLTPVSIPHTLIDYVVEVDKIGDPAGIVSGTTQLTNDPARLLMGKYAAELIEHSGYFKEGFSFQTGAGGSSIAAAEFVRETMKERRITGSFGVGGITSCFVNMLEEGLFQKLLDVQSFDLKAVQSSFKNANHIEMSASMYANPHVKGCVVDLLDIVLLGATEIDLDFNVNVNTEVDGHLLHGIGGHMDTSAGAKLTIIIAPLFRGRIPLVVKKVLTITSPGETIDALVTERGIAINPKRQDLIDRLKNSKLPLKTMEELLDISVKMCGKPKPLEFEDEIIGIIEYRDGTVIDVVRKVAV